MNPKTSSFQLFKAHRTVQDRSVFGGALSGTSNPKIKRPISTRLAMHVVMRSRLARGSRSLLTKANRDAVDQILRKQSARWGIRIYRYENVGNHLHLLLRPRTRSAMVGFVRSVTGLIARRVLNAERTRGVLKHSPNNARSRFWDARPFSRFVHWGRSFAIINRYLDKNQAQALGFVIIRPSDIGDPTAAVIGTG